MKNNVIRLVCAAAFAAVLAGCSTTAPDASTQSRSVSFPKADSAWLKGGAFVDVEQLRRMGLGMSKGQVRDLISYPHFGEGLFGPAEWDYLFNFRTGKGDEFVTCQYKVVFKDGVSSATHWKEPACADYLKPKVSEVVRPVSTQGASERFKLGADALFAFDRSTASDILPEGRKQLDALATQLKGQYKRLDAVTVVGHTDRLGGDAYNQQLSMSRAATVRDYLIAQGLPKGSLRAAGVGKTQPVVQCAETMARAAMIECLQPNRRVEIEVLGER
jgi:OmpA-OmpF porin, OOP family